MLLQKIQTYDAFCALIIMSVERSVDEAADQVDLSKYRELLTDSRLIIGKCREYPHYMKL